MILDRICSIYHLTRDADNADKEQYKLDIGLINTPLHIQPGGNEDTILSDGVFTQTWVGFTTESGIRSGDKITISGAVVSNYMVRGLQNWDFGDCPHYGLTLLEFEEDETS